MKDLNANSYDLLDAQQLLGAILPKQKLTQTEQRPPAGARNFLDFSSHDFARQSRPNATVTGKTEESDPEFDSKSMSFDSWESVIAWCMSVSRGEAGFVVDSQGFVIASRGRIPPQGIEGIGAEMLCSIEQLERIDPDAGRLLSVEMEFNKKRLVGFVTASGEAGNYLIGIIAPESLDYASKKKIIQQVVHNLLNID